MLRPSILDDETLDNVFDDFFHDSFGKSSSMRPVTVMCTDISETPLYYQIDMELAGFTKEEIRAELKEGYLIVRASRSIKQQETNESLHYLRKERYTGHYQRQFYVGPKITEKDITAIFKNGLLTLTIPKEEKEHQIAPGNLIEIKEEL